MTSDKTLGSVDTPESPAPRSSPASIKGGSFDGRSTWVGDALKKPCELSMKLQGVYFGAFDRLDLAGWSLPGQVIDYWSPSLVSVTLISRKKESDGSGTFT